MIVIEDAVHHTGTNTDKGVEIPLSEFEVTVRTKNNEPFGEGAVLNAIDEGDAISQYIALKKIPNKKTPGLRFKAEVLTEKRSDALNPPEPKAKVLSSASKAENTPAAKASKGKSDK